MQSFKENMYMELDLKIEVIKRNDYAVLELIGEVDAYTSSRFREIIISVIEEGNVDVVINMLEVEYIDSSGLGALVGGLKRATERNGRILILCNNPQVKKVFEITGLEKVFPIFINEKDAANSILSQK
jgi:anti-sigma B factor antagonist